MNLSSNQRNHLAPSTFGLPAQRKYPMPDRAHAVVAKSYAAKESHAGKLSTSQKSEIDAKANRVLASPGTIHHAPGCPGTHLGAC